MEKSVECDQWRVVAIVQLIVFNSLHGRSGHAELTGLEDQDTQVNYRNYRIALTAGPQLLLASDFLFLLILFFS